MLFKKGKIGVNTPLNIKTPEGFKQLYDLYSNKMYKVCLSLTKDKELAGDLVQEVFESIWKRGDRLVIEGVIEHYLLRAVKLRLIDYYRTKTSHQNHEECAFSEHCLQDNYTEHEVLFNELQDKVNELLDKLPCQCRKVYTLSQNQGLSNKEIASRLLISEAAVSYHLKKATSFLKEKLAVMYDVNLCLVFISLIYSA